MRSSDWSSDVCSSDLGICAYSRPPAASAPPLPGAGQGLRPYCLRVYRRETPFRVHRRTDRTSLESGGLFAHIADRKSVVEGKSVSVRLDIGGCRLIKKKNNKKLTI